MNQATESCFLIQMLMELEVQQICGLNHICKIGSSVFKQIIWKALSSYQEDLKKLNITYLNGQFVTQSYFHYKQIIFQLIYKGQRCVIFADDTIIRINATNEDVVNQKINRVMQQLRIWFNVSGLVINTKEIITILCHTWKNKGDLKPHIIFKGIDIKCKQETKFLGLFLTDDMKWGVHIKYTSSKLNRSYCVMQSLNGKTSVNILINVYFVTFLHI